MSYSSTFSGLNFSTESPFEVVEKSFTALKTAHAARWNDEVYIRCEGDEDDDGPCEVEVCFKGHGVTDSRVIYALCEWTKQWLGPNQVVRVYQASRSDTPGEAPFFYVVTEQGISELCVDGLFDVHDLFVSWAAQRKPPLTYTDLAEGTEPGRAGAVERLRRLSAHLEQQRSKREQSPKPDAKGASKKR